jgi:hypothetical protein
MVQAIVKKNPKTLIIELFFDSSNFGVFEQIGNDPYSFFPRKQHLLTGDHYIVIGYELNKLNAEHSKSQGYTST